MEDEKERLGAIVTAKKGSEMQESLLYPETRSDCYPYGGQNSVYPCLYSTRVRLSDPQLLAQW